MFNVLNANQKIRALYTRSIRIGGTADARNADMSLRKLRIWKWRIGGKMIDDGTLWSGQSENIILELDEDD